MELRQLRYFREIVRHANFGRAADALGVTQPALSKSMRALEQELGVELLERSANGVVVTPFGRILGEYAATICTELDRAVEEIRALNGRSSGLVRVGGSTTVLRYFMPEVLRQLQPRYPDIEVSVIEGLRDDLTAALRSGELDLALSLSLDDATMAEFAVERLLGDTIAVVASRDHPLAAQTDVTLADLVPYRWVLPNRREHERQSLFDLFRVSGLPIPKVAVQTGSSVLMAALMQGQHHLSYLPQSLRKLDPVFADLTPLPLALHGGDTEMWLLTRRRSVQLPATRAFIAAVREIAQRADTTKLRRHSV